MPEDHIRYDLLTQVALRGVVRTVLADAAKKGLPGDHHFKITFNTEAPDVRLSDRMRTQYPIEMTIVLQHQFWDLIVRDDGFEVGLSFGGVPERLAIPFDAITAFYDPAVQFGFQFEDAAKAAAEKTLDEAAPRASSENAKERKSADTLPAPSLQLAKPASEPPPAGGGEVVRLDRFRKK
jgi:hypothetical protein